MVPEIKPTAGEGRPRRARVRARPRRTSPGSTCCRSAASSTTRRSATTTRSSRRTPSTTSTKLSDDDRRIYDLVARRFLAVFHPTPVFENTRVETTVEEHVFRTRGRVLRRPRLARRLRRAAEARAPPTRTRARPAAAEASSRARPSTRATAEALEKETKPPRRYSDASLLGAMETAGKLVDDDELREAMKDSGIGTPATRAAIIERLIDVGYVERDAPRARADREGHERHPPARRPRADVARDLTGEWEHRLGADRGAARRRASGS